MSSFLGFQPTERPGYFFISYNTEDVDRIAPIATALSREGIPLWYDYNIEYGEEWEPKLSEKIADAKSVILFFTKGIFAKEHSYVRKEYKMAKILNKKVYVVMVDEISHKDIPPRALPWWVDISEQQCIPAYKLQPDKLLIEIKRALGIQQQKKNLPAQTERQSPVAVPSKNDKYQARPAQTSDNAAKTFSIPVITAETLEQLPAGSKAAKTKPSSAQVLPKEKNQALPAKTNTVSADFKITNGTLMKYEGSEAHVSIPNNVTRISARSFSSCESLISVTIPDSVTYIGPSAFENCKKLTSLTIPDRVTSICEYAFSGCDALTSITIPNSVSYIGINPFAGCNNLTEIAVLVQNPSFCVENGHLIDMRTKTLIAGCANAPIPANGSVVCIGDNAFSGHKTLTSIAIPDSVTSIGKYVFSSCSALISVSIPNSVSYIGANPFAYCSNLTEIAVSTQNPCFCVENGHLIDRRTKTLIAGCANAPIPANGSVVCIGDNAFSGHKTLTSIAIPDSVTSLGNSAFSGCTALTSVTIPNSVTSIGKFAFSSCKALAEVTIPNSVTTIEGYTFLSCDALTSVSIPNGVTTVGGFAFSKCTALTSVTIPNSVTSIGDWAFFCCKNLTSVSIPNSVTTIEMFAFSTCTGLRSITIPSSVTKIGLDAFENCDNMTIFTQKNSYAWKWAEKNHIPVEKPKIGLHTLLPMIGK